MVKKTALRGEYLSPLFQMKKGKSWIYNAHHLRMKLSLGCSWRKQRVMRTSRKFTASRSVLCEILGPLIQNQL